MTEPEALAQFISCYLHQDWTDDYADVWVAADDFALSEPEDAPRLAGEVEALLGDAPSERNLMELVDKFEGNYRPEADGLTYRAWLLALVERVERTRAH
ncbi:MAG: contact-dependent growth inhibition system immunity protein [Jatrophihabitans sp.]